MNQEKEAKFRKGTRRGLVAAAYDLPMLLLSVFIFLYLSPSVGVRPRLIYIGEQFCFCTVCVFAFRVMLGIYRQIMRYGGSRAYIRLITADFCAGVVYYIIQLLLPEGPMRITFLRAVCIVAFNLLEAVSARLMYQYIFEFGSRRLWSIPAFRVAVKAFTGLYIEDPQLQRAGETPLEASASEEADAAVATAAAGAAAHNKDAAASGAGSAPKVAPASGSLPASAPLSSSGLRYTTARKNLAIIGAGRIGAMLAKELMTNQHSAYRPVFFVDRDEAKAGREIYGIPVIAENEHTIDILRSNGVSEIVFALPRLHAEQKSELYNRYRDLGCRILIYDYPLSQTSEFGKRTLREFNIEELLFRDAKEFMSDEVRAFYAGKTVMVTGGGGSIGSELCRQIVKMDPKQLVILDVYENCAYDIQQELWMTYGRGVIPFEVEICSITDRRKLEHVFATYRPEIVIHAAAHKHVPLMEHNVTEAVENNVFGTKNVIDLARKYQVKNFLMVSTDKAVNPTNVMGATKRMCEMLVMSAAHCQGPNPTTKFCATRFGNVLGSNGSVVPLFKKQIAHGGPVTITDRRIIRYFMTIPEATQLVLTCCALSRNGELFALDMGKPMSILNMAENMIRLSGFEPYKDIPIVEVGLRPGEKLYEELLINFDELEKTDNDMIYVEHQVPPSEEEMAARLAALHTACDTLTDSTVYTALQAAVPTFHPADEVNKTALESREFKASRA